MLWVWTTLSSFIECQILFWQTTKLMLDPLDLIFLCLFLCFDRVVIMLRFCHILGCVLYSRLGPGPFSQIGFSGVLVECTPCSAWLLHCDCNRTWSPTTSQSLVFLFSSQPCSSYSLLSLKEFHSAYICLSTVNVLSQPLKENPTQTSGPVFLLSCTVNFSLINSLKY